MLDALAGSGEGSVSVTCCHLPPFLAGGSICQHSERVSASPGAEAALEGQPMFVSSAELSSRSHIPEWLLRALSSVLEQPGAGRASGEPWPKVEHVLHPWPCTDLHTLYSTCRITWVREKYRNILQEKNLCNFPVASTGLHLEQFQEFSGESSYSFSSRNTD